MQCNLHRYECGKIWEKNRRRLGCVLRWCALLGWFIFMACHNLYIYMCVCTCFWALLLFVHCKSCTTSNKFQPIKPNAYYAICFPFTFIIISLCICINWTQTHWHSLWLFKRKVYKCMSTSTENFLFFTLNPCH